MHLLNLDYAHKLYTLHREDFPQVHWVYWGSFYDPLSDDFSVLTMRLQRITEQTGCQEG